MEMTMGSFEKVARLADLQETRAMRLELDGHQIMLVRRGAEVRAFAAQCPHAGAPLDEGAICRGRIVCPWHKATFDAADGRLLEPPALHGLQRYPVRLDDGDVYVEATPEPANPVEFRTSRCTSGSGPASGASMPSPLSNAADPSPPAGSALPSVTSVKAGNVPRCMAIVGAGAAGTCAALTLREAGFTGRVVLIGREPGVAYDRTSLSKFVLSGEMAPDEVPALADAAFFERHAIELEHSAVRQLDAGSRQITFQDGRSLAFDSALLAPGGEPQRLDLPGAGLDGVLTLRSRDDAAAIVSRLHTGSRAVILGNSFIGLEAASALRKRGIAVTVVAPSPIPFEKQFGKQLGAMFARLHQDNGVALRVGKAARFEAGTAMTAGASRAPGSAPGNGYPVNAIVLEDGTRLPADLVIVGTGVRPATGFVAGLDLRDDGGITVDDGMRAADGLYAAGDVAAFPFGPAREHIRIEHWRVAQQHARVAAHNMLAGNERYAGVPFFWTYHYGKRFEYLGHSNSWDEVLIEGDLASHRFVALYVAEGHVVATLACDRERATAMLAELLRAPLASAAALEVVRANA
jgi:NADPH-dependent 2,4-dienoyl-CoA reductase/sulfur reductase-like enzyme/nitrite reductase/ring-hydroxylating ferredoxin subunit